MARTGTPEQGRREQFDAFSLRTRRRFAPSSRARVSCDEVYHLDNSVLRRRRAPRRRTSAAHPRRRPPWQRGRALDHILPELRASGPASFRVRPQRVVFITPRVGLEWSGRNGRSTQLGRRPTPRRRLPEGERKTPRPSVPPAFTEDNRRCTCLFCRGKNDFERASFEAITSERCRWLRCNSWKGRTVLPQKSRC